ncbi:superoxide dismutase family protein [Oceanobacillus sp. CAU 1775]
MNKLFFVLMFVLSACLQSDSDAVMEVEVRDTAGDSLGTATFTEHPEGVQIKLELEGIPPGPHGIHVHENPKCDPPDFTSAGEHFDPGDMEHGLMNPKGPHLGDLPNIEADDSGKVDVELILAEATLLDGKNSITKGEGTSLIIHESADDGFSQPSGNSGPRIACGVISNSAE